VLASFARMTESKRQPTHRVVGGAWEQQSGPITPRRRNPESRRPPDRHGTRGSPCAELSCRRAADDCIVRMMRTVGGLSAMPGERHLAGKASSLSGPQYRTVAWLLGRAGALDVRGCTPVLEVNLHRTTFLRSREGRSVAGREAPLVTWTGCACIHPRRQRLVVRRWRRLRLPRAPYNRANRCPAAW
jgi:hypothetical protein